VRNRRWRPGVSDPPCGLGTHGPLHPAHELPASGGHSDGRSPAPPSRGVRRSGEGQESRHQGHPEGNQELLQKNTRLETRIRELNDELMRTYHSRDFKTDDLDGTHTGLQYAQDELTATQSYIHHLETELYKRDEQLQVSQAQAADLQHEVEHLQGLIPSELEEPEDPEEDPEEIEGMSSVDDD
jgi:chromosome segregation ATPase